jgi:hypothetical protein
MRAAEMSVRLVERSGPRMRAGAAKLRRTSARDLWDPKVHTKFWLEALTLASDAWLRSGAFLKLMQYALKAAIGVKRLQDRATTNSGPAIGTRDGYKSLPPSRSSKEG